MSFEVLKYCEILYCKLKNIFFLKKKIFLKKVKVKCTSRTAEYKTGEGKTPNRKKRNRHIYVYVRKLVKFVYHIPLKRYRAD